MLEHLHNVTMFYLMKVSNFFSEIEMFKNLPEPSSRKRKIPSQELLGDMRLAKSASTLWVRSVNYVMLLKNYPNNYPQGCRIGHFMNVVMLWRIAPNMK